MSSSIKDLYNIFIGKQIYDYKKIKRKLQKYYQNGINDKIMFDNFILLLENIIDCKIGNLEDVDNIFLGRLLKNINLSITSGNIDLTFIIKRFKDLRKRIKNKVCDDNIRRVLGDIGQKLLDIEYTRNKEFNCYDDFLIEIIINLGSVELVKKHIENNPEIINLRDSYNKHIFLLILKKYLSLTKENKILYPDDYEESLRNIMYLFLCAKNKHLNKKDLREIKELVKSSLLSYQTKEHVLGNRVYYLLNQIVSEIENTDDDKIRDKWCNCFQEGTPLIFNNRRNLTNVYTVAIDREENSRSEDAFSLHREKDDYILMIHVVDMTDAFKYNNLVDPKFINGGIFEKDTNDRYYIVPQDVINIRQLKKDTPRNTLTFELRISNCGELLGIDFFRSVISLNEKITFSEANKRIDNDKSLEYEDLQRMLKQCYVLSGLISSRKKNEIRKEVYHSNKSRDMLRKNIEFLNNAVAGMCIKNNIPFIRDIHHVREKSQCLKRLKCMLYDYSDLSSSLFLDIEDQIKEDYKYPFYSTDMSKYPHYNVGNILSPFKYFSGCLNLQTFCRFFIDEKHNTQDMREMSLAEREKYFLHIVPKLNAITFYRHCQEQKRQQREAVQKKKEEL